MVNRLKFGLALFWFGVLTTACGQSDQEATNNTTNEATDETAVGGAETCDFDETAPPTDEAAELDIGECALVLTGPERDQRAAVVVTAIEEADKLKYVGSEDASQWLAAYKVRVEWVNLADGRDSPAIPYLQAKLKEPDNPMQLPGLELPWQPRRNELPEDEECDDTQDSPRPAVAPGEVAQHCSIFLVPAETVLIWAGAGPYWGMTDT